MSRGGGRGIGGRRAGLEPGIEAVEVLRISVTTTVDSIDRQDLDDLRPVRRAQALDESRDALGRVAVLGQKMNHHGALAAGIPAP